MRFRWMALAALVSVGAALPDLFRPLSKPYLSLRVDKPGHLFEASEPVQLEVTGASDGERLRFERSDPSGRSLGTVTGTVIEGRIDLGEFEPGWYHLHGDGGSDIEVAVAERRAEPSFRDESPYGVVAPPHVEGEWPLLAEMGAAWLQWSAAWAYMETQPGLYWYLPNAPKSYGDPEGFVRDANRHGIRTVIQFRTTPRWANKGRIGRYRGTEVTRTDTYPPDDDHWDDYSKFVGQVVDRFKPMGVSHYEIWSEAEGSMFQRWEAPPFPKVEAYQKLLQNARKVIKAKDPDARLIGPGDEPVEFLRRAEGGYTAQAMWNNRPDEYAGSSLTGIGKAVDIVSGHFYWTDWVSRPRKHWGPEEANPGRKPDTLKEMLADARDLGGARPVWVTEVGYGSAVSGETPDSIAPNEDGQANLLVRYFVLSRAWGAKKTFWYRWKDTASSSYGLLRQDGTVKPAYLSYRTMTQRLEGLKDVKVIEPGPNRWVVHYSGAKTVIVLWKRKAGQKPETVSVPWVKSRVTRRDGKELVEMAVNGKVQISLNDGEPVYLEESP